MARERTSPKLARQQDTTEEKKHKGALWHEKPNGNPGISWRFQTKQCTDPAKCGREHICIACARSKGSLQRLCVSKQSTERLLLLNFVMPVQLSLLLPVNLSSPVCVLLVSASGGRRDEILQGWSYLQSSFISPLPLELLHKFFNSPEAALLPIWDLLDRIRGGYFQLVCVLPLNETWTSQLRSRRSPFGLEDLDPEAAQQVFHANACCECSAWIAEQAAIPQSVPPDPGFSGGSWR